MSSMAALGHGLPLRRRSERARCTSESCRLCCVAAVDSPGPIPTVVIDIVIYPARVRSL
jgi:hypothetical protein